MGNKLLYYHKLSRIKRNFYLKFDYALKIRFFMNVKNIFIHKLVCFYIEITGKMLCRLTTMMIVHRIHRVYTVCILNIEKRFPGIDMDESEQNWCQFLCY